MDGETEQVKSTPNPPKAIFRLLEDARRRLVEKGTRNRLIHTNLQNNRLKVVHVVNERADDVYELLRTNGKRMQFKACGTDESVEDDVLLAGEIPVEPFDEARFTDNYLETPLGPDRLAKRLLALAKDAKTAEEEQGINLLFLAVGFLTWREDKNSDVDRTAPLILLPIELVRNQKTSTYDIRARSDDLVTNLPLQERLREDFGLLIPDIDENDEWSPNQYFDLLEPIVAERKGWSIDRDRMIVGLFSFAKILMMRDLDPANWVNGELLSHDLLSGLLVSGFESEEPLFSDGTKLDDVMEPQDIIQVVDADASQTKVIEEVRAGRNLVVQGPPGTGKSQTITNIIASAVHDGKTVLFVAEKMAALSVVYKRLVDSGLSDVCLELHSRSANKKVVLHELARTLQAAASVHDATDSSDELKKARDHLNRIADELHTLIEGRSFSPFSVLSRLIRFIGQNIEPSRLQNQSLADLSSEETDELVAGIHRYKELLGEMGVPGQHPFYGARNINLQPLHLERLKREAQEATQRVDAVVERVCAAIAWLEVSRPANLITAENLIALHRLIDDAPDGLGELLEPVLRADRIEDLIFAAQKAIDYQMARSAASRSFSDAALAFPASSVRAPIAAGTSFWSRLGGAYRSASKQIATVLTGTLPKTQVERLSLVDTLLDLQKKHKAFEEYSPALRSVLGTRWRGEETNFEAFEAALKWCARLHEIDLLVSVDKLQVLLSNQGERCSVLGLTEQTLTGARTALEGVSEKLLLDLQARFGSSDIAAIELEALVQALTDLMQNTGRYDEWREYVKLLSRFEAANLLELLNRIDAGQLDMQSATAEFLYAQAEQQWEVCRSSVPQLEELRDLSRHELVDAFRALEKQRIIEVRERIRMNHLDQLPTGAVGEMAYIRGELAKKRKHKSIRQLMENAGNMVQRIKPAVLMSPISVAQFLPPEKLTFDLLVVDEASQIRPEDALGAVVRARQIVVVGDRKQLPPTSFFDRVSGDTDEDEEHDDELGNAAKATEMESILTLCEARGLRSEMLSWHYRSRDPSLIKVSNAEFYNHGLILPPSPLEKDESYGLKLTQVQGVYAPGNTGEGRPRTNKIEAQAIVQRVKEHARAHPDLSLGVATFSVSQRSMVEELLEFERRGDRTLDHFLREGRNEDFFVKNIENVQGDERDVILISVCYGPVIPGGRLSSMRFGPVNGEGGERRLNVLFSRARVRCEVFVSFDPRDMDLSKTSKDGPRILKTFLEFARTGRLDEKLPSGLGADSPFEEDVADVIRGLGYSLDHQVGSAGFLIDIAVKHPKRPGQYMIAVECDGATYHSALWARERDRLRQDILEHLGWKFYRIWSTDWFHRREREVERLRQALSDAQADSEDGISVEGANLNDPVPEDDSEVELVELGVKFEQLVFTGTPYKRAETKADTSMEPHEVAAPKLAEIAVRIIEIEGPIHEDEIARRIAAAFAKHKAGQRIVDATKRALKIVQRTHPEIANDDGFWLTDIQRKAPVVRDRSEQNAATQKASMISPLEIRAAREQILAESGEVQADDLARAIANMLGFKRLGQDLRKWIVNALGLPDGHSSDP